MKIPKEVKIGSHIYKVKIVDSINENPMKMGQSDHGELEITLRKMKPSMMENTFLHELIHCFNTEFENETLQQSLVDGLQLFLIDNPGVFK